MRFYALRWLGRDEVADNLYFCDLLFWALQSGLLTAWYRPTVIVRRKLCHSIQQYRICIVMLRDSMQWNTWKTQDNRTRDIRRYWARKCVLDMQVRSSTPLQFKRFKKHSCLRAWSTPKMPATRSVPTKGELLHWNTILKREGTLFKLIKPHSVNKHYY